MNRFRAWRRTRRGRRIVDLLVVVVVLTVTWLMYWLTSPPEKFTNELILGMVHVAALFYAVYMFRQTRQDTRRGLDPRSRMPSWSWPKKGLRPK